MILIKIDWYLYDGRNDSGHDLLWRLKSDHDHHRGGTLIITLFKLLVWWDLYQLSPYTTGISSALASTLICNRHGTYVSKCNSGRPNPAAPHFSYSRPQDHPNISGTCPILPCRLHQRRNQFCTFSNLCIP